MQRQKRSPFFSLISAATGAPDRLIPLLESLMRDEVFHSTLDWQSAQQLTDGAKHAYDLYWNAPAYHDGVLILQKSKFRLAQAEARLAKARMTGCDSRIADLEIRAELARESIRLARESLPRLAVFHSL